MTVKELQGISKSLSQKISQIKDINGEHSPIQDGIVDFESYLNTKYKILWVLKEANSPDDSEWNQVDALRDFVATQLNSEWKKTFQHIIYFTYGLLNNLVWEQIPDIDDEDNSIVEVLKSIAFINIKKIPGKSQALESELWKYSEKDKDILVEQITLFNPDIVIFGNTLKYLVNDLGLKEDIQEQGTIQFTTENGKLLINIYHPNYISRGKVNARDYYSLFKQICDSFLQTISE